MPRAATSAMLSRLTWKQERQARHIQLKAWSSFIPLSFPVTLPSSPGPEKTGNLFLTSAPGLKKQPARCTAQAQRARGRVHPCPEAQSRGVWGTWSMRMTVLRELCCGSDGPGHCPLLPAHPLDPRSCLSLCPSAHPRWPARTKAQSPRCSETFWS